MKRNVVRKWQGQKLRTKYAQDRARQIMLYMHL